MVIDSNFLRTIERSDLSDEMDSCIKKLVRDREGTLRETKPQSP